MVSYPLSRAFFFDLLEVEMMVLVVSLASPIASLFVTCLSMMALKKANFHSQLVHEHYSKEALIDRMFFIFFYERVVVLYVESMLWPRVSL